MVDTVQRNYNSGVGSYTTQSLSAGNLSKVKSILSKYNPKLITAEDAKEIFNEFRKLGIQAGDDLRAAVKAQGFDYKHLRTLIGQSVEAKDEAKKKKAEENEPADQGNIDVTV